MSARLVSVMLEEESLPPLRTSSMDSGLRAALTGEIIIAFKSFCIKLKKYFLLRLVIKIANRWL